MGIGGGIFPVKSGLTFGLDVGNHRYYPGEPTTNILPDASNSGRFTTSNSWGTYNTNQYNNNTYFSIGSIVSVAGGAIVTDGNHPLRSFDVVTPQTSGGGLTAGTNYVVKKLSNTSFSLHSYNGSQDGSQGYINPETGFYKVHDAYATNTQVSVTSTGFPTMWWGPPHLPNSGLIKEIVTNGGRVPNTNCMRWHIYRADTVTDGMAYGIYTPVTAGDTITVSYYMRAATDTAVGKGGYYTTYFGGNSAYSGGFSWGGLGEWVRNVHQWTASVTYSFYQYWFCDGATVPYSVDIADLQVEVNKGHVTPFTTTSRSATTSITDVKRTTTVDVSNVSFDSSGFITFDGTNDYLDFNAPNLGSTVTVEMVAKIGASYDGRMFFGWNAYDVFCALGAIGYNTGNGDVYGFNSSVVSSLGCVGNWKHYIFEMRSDVSYTNNKIYVNGVQQTLSQILSSEFSGNRNFNSGNGRIASWRNGAGYFMPMDCHVFRVYNRALTQNEIDINFAAYKLRFNM